jgi:hypothetical protein
LLLTRHVPHRSEPGTKRRTGLLENRTRAHSALVTATPANQPAPRGSVRFAFRAASRTSKPVRPADTLQIPGACFLISKPIHKLVPGTWIIPSRNGFWRPHAHHYILTWVELIGYPV